MSQPVLLDEGVWATMSESTPINGLMFDYDGTLVPYCDHPEDAVPDSDLLELLHQLASRFTVGIISARPRRFFDQHFSNMPIIKAAEHGAWRHDGEWQRHYHGDTGWISALQHKIQETTGPYPHSEVILSEVSLVWHYRHLRSEHKANLIDTVSSLQVPDDIECVHTTEALEFKPKACSKYNPAEHLINTYGGHWLAAGDTASDIPLYQAVQRSGTSIHVGDSIPHSNYFTPTPDTLRSFLVRLV